MASDKASSRYCHCGNVEIRDAIGSEGSGSEAKVVWAPILWMALMFSDIRF